jgi:Tfp pilus assembly protein PilO
VAVATSKAEKATQKLSSNNFIIVMLLITLLTLGISGIVVKMLFSSITRDMKVVSAKSKADKQLKENLKAAPLLVDDFNALGEEKTLLENALPTSIDFPSLMVTIENMTTVSGLKLKSIEPTLVTVDDAAAAGGTAAASTANSEAPQPQTYAFSIATDGTYESLQKFLQDVETSARPMRVTAVQMNGSSKSLSAQIDLETYYQDKAQLPLGKETIK